MPTLPTLKLQSPFAVDVRGLVWLRVSLGGLVLVDLIQRGLTLRAHYTDEGVLPASAVLEKLPSVYWFASGTASVAILFALTAACAVALIIGWQTRLATLLTWLLVASLQNRNIPVYHSGDAVLRLALFWSLFLPLGARASVDAKSRPASGTRITGPAAFAFVVQFTLIFFCALDFKLQGHAWAEGTAVEDALRVSLYARPLAGVLLGYPALLTFFTYATLAAQGLVPLLLLVPVRQPIFRIAAVATVVAMQAGFGSSMNLGTFPWIVIAWAIALLPAEVWDAVVPRQAGDLPASRSLEKAAAVIALGLVLLWNLGEAGATTNTGVPVNSLWPGRLALQLRLDQRWAMFAPNPQTEDGVFSVIGQQGDGQVELLSALVGGSEVDRPLSSNQRWLLYFLELQARASPELLSALGQFACRADASVQTVTIRFAHFDHLRNGGRSPTVVSELWTERCRR